MGRRAAHEAKMVIELTDSGKEVRTSELAYLRPDDDVLETGTG